MISIKFGFLVKYFIPLILLPMLVSQCRNDYWNTPTAYGVNGEVVVGLLTFIIMLIMIAVVAVKPELMEQEWDNEVEMSADPAKGDTFAQDEPTGEKQENIAPVVSD